MSNHRQTALSLNRKITGCLEHAFMRVMDQYLRVGNLEALGAADFADLTPEKLAEARYNSWASAR